jgi:hypothetical protein
MFVVPVMVASAYASTYPLLFSTMSTAGYSELTVSLRKYGIST